MKGHAAFGPAQRYINMLLLILLKGHYEINKIIIITNTALMSRCWLVKLLLSSSV